EALLDVSRLVLGRGRDRDLAGQRESLALQGDIDAPQPVQDLLLDRRPPAARFGPALDDLLEVLVLRPAPARGRSDPWRSGGHGRRCGPLGLGSPRGRYRLALLPSFRRLPDLGCW